jgi:hypothetical protein
VCVGCFVCIPHICVVSIIPVEHCSTIPRRSYAKLCEGCRSRKRRTCQQQQQQ